MATSASLRYALYSRLAQPAALCCWGEAEPEANGLWVFFSGKLPVMSHQPPFLCGSLRAVSCCGFPFAAVQGEAQCVLGCAALLTSGRSVA